MAALLLAAAPASAAQRGNRSGMHAGDALAKDKVAEWRGNAQVSGRITDEAGKGINEARVAFIFATSNDGFFATTKKNGEYSANDVKAGLWRVQVEAPTFVTVTQDLTLEDKKNLFNVTLKRDYRAIAFTYGREGNHREALRTLDLALAANPSDPVLLQLAYATAIDLQDYPRAAAYLARVDDATLTDPAMLVNSAVALLKQGRTDDAIAVLGRLIERFPDSPDPHFYRGYAFAQSNRSPEAKADLEKYLTLAPDGPQAANAKTLLAAIR